MKKVISTPNAPEAIGPYSQAIEKNGMLFISGQIPINPKTGQMKGTTIQEQTQQVLENLSAVLAAAGFVIADVVKTTCYIKDMNQFAEMNKVYSTVFTENCPARATIEVSRLPKDALVEIDAVAIK